MQFKIRSKSTFARLYEKLDRLNRNDPNNWLQISNIFKNLSDGYAIMITYAENSKFWYVRSELFRQYSKSYNELHQTYLKNHQEYEKNLDATRPVNISIPRSGSIEA